MYARRLTPFAVLNAVAESQIGQLLCAFNDDPLGARSFCLFGFGLLFCFGGFVCLVCFAL